MNNKDIIYVDIDDEITTIIDKVRSSSGKVVALVLPKRATVFQSIVNMKLLKRTAEAAKKHLVLITTETGLMPLAGSVGLHVAATPQSKPEIPSMTPHEAEEVPSDDSNESDDRDEAYTTSNAGDRPIGELAGLPSESPKHTESIETLELPDEQDDEEDTKPKKVKQRKDKHLKVPNFNKFRLKLFLGVFMIALIAVALYVGLVIMPKATIKISTQASGQNVSLNLTLNPSAQALDQTGMVVPAKVEQQQKTVSQQVATTGQQNNGTAASGSVTMSAGTCSGTPPQPVAAGTGLSTSGLTFITQAETNFTPVVLHGQCTWQATGQTTIAAQSAGAKYNVSGATFAVAGRSDVAASGSTSNGTDNIIQIVTQADIDTAKQKLGTQDTSAIQSSLEQTLQSEGLYPLTATFNAGTPVITTSNNVGDQAANVTVTEAVTYTLYGASRTNLDALITSAVAKQISMQSQSILNDGLSGATVSVTGSSNGSDQVSLQTTATVGPSISVSMVKKQAEGKKVGDVKTAINAIPGVTSVNVQLSPFWVGSVPTNAQKISVTISGVK